MFATLVAANSIGVFIANFRIFARGRVVVRDDEFLFPLIYVSGFFRNQNPDCVLAFLRDFVPFAYMNDALKTVFGLASEATPLAVFVYPTIICGRPVLRGMPDGTAPAFAPLPEPSSGGFNTLGRCASMASVLGALGEEVTKI